VVLITRFRDPKPGSLVAGRPDGVRVPVLHRVLSVRRDGSVLTRAEGSRSPDPWVVRRVSGVAFGPTIPLGRWFGPAAPVWVIAISAGCVTWWALRRPGFRSKQQTRSEQ